MEEFQKFHTVRGYQLLEQNKKLLTPAMEDYLEMIYRESLTLGYTRINTLSELLSVQAPSVTKMVQKLSVLGMVSYKKYNIISLTETGTDIGKFLLDRHNTIELFLSNIGVKESLLIETELMEHIITASTLNNIYFFNIFFDKNSEVSKLYHAQLLNYNNSIK